MTAAHIIAALYIAVMVGAFFVAVRGTLLGYEFSRVCETKEERAWIDMLIRDLELTNEDRVPVSKGAVSVLGWRRLSRAKEAAAYRRYVEKERDRVQKEAEEVAGTKKGAT